MHEYTHEHQPADAPSSPSASYIVRTIKSYLPIIGLGMAAVAIGYIIVAVALYILAPSSRVTSVAFRLDWDGAARGEYPNGQKFSPVAIISTPVLIKTFNDNKLGQYMSYADFSKSVVVLQANAALEVLARDYAARLGDTRLSAVDRERIQREYELKTASLAKNQYAIHYIREGGKRDAVPETIVHKVITDILRNWAHFAANEQHVLEYRVAVLSPDVVSAAATAGTNPIIDVVMMRDKVQRLIQNIELLRLLPAAELARTKEGLTLSDLQVRLEDIVRFRVDPLVTRIAAAGLDNRTETLRFLETQLSADQRRLQSQLQKASAVQGTLAMYIAEKAELPSETSATSGDAPPQMRRPENGAVMPQVSENFLDRLITLANRSVDSDFRQRLAEEYRNQSLRIAPMQEAVAYDQDVLALIRGTSGGASVDAASVTAAIAELRNDTRMLAGKVGEIHKDVSSNLDPATELVTPTPPFSRVERATSLKRLFMYGILTLALALPVVVVLCLIHNHIKREEEEEQDQIADQSPSAIPSR